MLGENYMTSISPEALQKEIEAGENVCLLDVRTPAEFAAAHVRQAILKPLETFKPVELASYAADSPDKVYVICQSGARAQKAVRQLEAAGVTGCVLVEGGISRWLEAGLPVERTGAEVMSLERQVRIVAGALVLLGTVLGAVVHPAILALPAFVGGGLMFAGISDKCGMAMVLARMPWNQIRETNGRGSSCGGG
jgi:rhodanese-related sulfurtransferase